MNGVEIAEEAKRLQPNIRAIFKTGYAEDGTFRDRKLDPGVTLLKNPYHRA